MNPTPDNSHHIRCRRGFLRYSGLGLASALFGRRGLASPAGSPRPLPLADSCIVVLLTGGPSHLDMWDPKPDAPAEIRGEFCTIRTRIPDIRLCEHLPRLANQMHRCTLVRSVHHNVKISHAAAAYIALTGVSRGEVVRPASRQDHPAIGSVIAMNAGPTKTALPYVWLPFRTTENDLGGEPISGMLGGFLGGRFDPFFVLDDPSDPDFAVPSLTPSAHLDSDRQRSRAALLGRLNEGVLLDSHSDWVSLQQRGLDLLTSSDSRRVFSMGEEPDRLREAYGKNRFGASLLLARRLVERGSRVVCVSMGSNLNNSWDTHFNNFDTLRNTLLPGFDAGISSLIADLEQRGMLQRTLVLVFGEFGREPRIGKDAGRSHWPDCYTVLMAGGGIRQGNVFGSSDRHGAYPKSDGVTPADIIATVYRCLGLLPDPQNHLVDQLGKPLNLVPGGEPIDRLIQ